MGLVHDDHVPGHVGGSLEAAFVARDEIHRCDENALVQSRELRGVGVEGGAIDDPRIQSEFAEKLLLGPLLRQASGSHHEDLLDDTPEEEFFEKESRHDRLSGPRVVSEQETDPGERQEVAVDRLDLVGKRVDDA